jgi:hypothetical protein
LIHRPVYVFRSHAQAQIPFEQVCRKHVSNTGERVANCQRRSTIHSSTGAE